MILLPAVNVVSGAIIIYPVRVIEIDSPVFILPTKIKMLTISL